jgi:hypothetical protein
LNGGDKIELTKANLVTVEKGEKIFPTRVTRVSAVRMRS